MRAPTRCDVAIVGGGIIGTAIAFELARKGVRAVVLDRGMPGAEASSAAAGILGAQAESHGPSALTPLLTESRARFPALGAALREATGIDIEHRVCGVLRVAFTDGEEKALQSELERQRKIGLDGVFLSPAELSAREPALSDQARSAVLFEKDGRVDPPAYGRALRMAAQRLGATFRAGAPVSRVIVESGSARGVEVAGGERISTDWVVIAAGSWSGSISSSTLGLKEVLPVKGQIVQLRLENPLHGVVMGERVYLCPRDDGRVLVGSTMELAGFDKRVTAGAVATLLHAACELAPSLADAEFAGAWANFRPHTEDELPIIGQTTTPGLVIATGHHRNGILLSPITGEIVAKLVTGGPLPSSMTGGPGTLSAVDLDPFRPGVRASIA